MWPSSTPIFDLIRAIDSGRLEIKRATHTQEPLAQQELWLIVYCDLLRAFIYRLTVGTVQEGVWILQIVYL